MEKLYKRLLAITLSLALILPIGLTAFADRETERPFLSLGAEQTDSERQKVLELLGISEADFDNYIVIYVTNQDEHDYLDAYLSNEVIGTRAISSVVVESAEEGNGINVTTQNISYCTPGMYRNALITAGVTDADVRVVAPSRVTGTAALVGAMKSYEAMTGEALSDESKDAATNELIVTGEVGDSIGDQEKAEELLGLIKQEVVENNLNTDKNIGEAVDEAAKKLEISLSDKDRQLIIDLMKKISGLDLSINDLKSQAKDLYDKLSGLNVDEGFFASIGQWFSDLWNSIKDFFTNLFGGGSGEASDASASASDTSMDSDAAASPDQSDTASQSGGESESDADQQDASSQADSGKSSSTAQGQSSSQAAPDSADDTSSNDEAAA